FPVTTAATTFQWPIVVAATRGTVTASADLLVDPGGGVTLKSVSISPNSIVAGDSATLTIIMTGMVTGSFDAPVSLSSNSPAVGVPEYVTVPVGSSSTTFQLFGQAVAKKTTVTITAAYDTVVKSATITVSPSPNEPVVSSLSFNPNPVKGG